MSFISIINYGSGNLKSVYNAFNKILSRKQTLKVTSSHQDILKSSHIILPGVGTFESCINGLTKSSLIKSLEDKVLDEKKPFLGICVGMQMLANKGFENGEFTGLGWIEGDVKKIKTSDNTIKIPHMGWNDLQLKKRIGFTKLLLKKLEDSNNKKLCAYFVHSYNFNLKSKSNLVLTTQYGEDITAMIARENIIGTQFHPEKSHNFGLNFLKTFIEWEGG